MVKFSTLNKLKKYLNNVNLELTDREQALLLIEKLGIGWGKRSGRSIRLATLEISKALGKELINSKKRSNHYNIIEDYRIKILNHYITNDNTRNNLLTDIRKIIASIVIGTEGESLFNEKKFIFADPELSKKIKKKSSEIVKNRDKTKIDISLNAVQDFVKNNINITDGLLKEKNNIKLYFLYCAVLLSSYLRPTEMLLGEFKKVKGRENWINVVKIQKQKSWKPLERPLIGCTSEEFLKAIERLKTNKIIQKIIKDKKLNEKIQYGSINNSIRKLNVLPFIPKEKTTIYSLRHIAVLCARELYFPRMEIVLFVKEYLGHKSAETSLSYITKFRIINDLKEKNMELEERLKKAVVDNRENISILTTNFSNLEIESTLRNNLRLTKEQKINNIKQLIEKGYKTFKELKQFGYGARIIKEAKN